MNTTEVLFERALVMICSEWGKTREEAIAWLNDDSDDWTPRPTQSAAPAPGAFIQVTRVTNVSR